MYRLIIILFVASIILAQPDKINKLNNHKSIPIFVSFEECLDFRLRCPWDSTNVLYFKLPVEANVNIAVFSLKGKHISDISNVPMHIGRNTVKWNGKDSRGKKINRDVNLHICEAEPL